MHCTNTLPVAISMRTHPRLQMSAARPEFSEPMITSGAMNAASTSIDSDYCSDVSKSSFDHNRTNIQTCSDANGRVKINGCNTVCGFNFLTPFNIENYFVWLIYVNLSTAC